MVIAHQLLSHQRSPSWGDRSHQLFRHHRRKVTFSEWRGAGSGSSGGPCEEDGAVQPLRGHKGTGMSPPSSVHPAWPQGFNLCLSQGWGAGSGLFWAQILGFALDEAIRMALTCEAARKFPPETPQPLRPAPGRESRSNQAPIAAICEAFRAGKLFPAPRRSLTNSPSFVSDCNGQVLAPRI